MSMKCIFSSIESSGFLVIAPTFTATLILHPHVAFPSVFPSDTPHGSITSAMLREEITKKEKKAGLGSTNSIDSMQEEIENAVPDFFDVYGVGEGEEGQETTNEQKEGTATSEIKKVESKFVGHWMEEGTDEKYTSLISDAGPSTPEVMHEGCMIWCNR